VREGGVEDQSAADVWAIHVLRPRLGALPRRVPREADALAGIPSACLIDSHLALREGLWVEQREYSVNTTTSV